MRIALDAMGGDRAPVAQVKGAIIAAKELNVDVALVGPQELLAAELAKQGGSTRVSVIPAGGAISMEEDDVARAVHRAPDASINVAMAMVRDGEAEAVVSAGHTGAMLASAIFILRRIPGIERPAVGILLPYNDGRVLLIDAGANADSRPSHLLQFAQMGSVYMERVVGVSRPRIGLLNIGEEAGKGTELVQEAFERLQASDLNFIGNVEGVRVHRGIADVVVTDGFTGNIALKVGEGIADYILETVRSVIKSSPLFAGAALLLKPALKRALKHLQYEEYGGANLLGVNGIVVKAHGRSDALAIKNGIKVAKAAAESGLLATMRASFAPAEEPSPAIGR